MDGFDFDYWKNLAERDPAAYFRARDDVLRECIAEHPGYVAGLSELQRHIDATRALGGSPLQASRALFGLMVQRWPSFDAKPRACGRCWPRKANSHLKPGLFGVLAAHVEAYRSGI